MLRKCPLISGEVYHVFNRSIAKYKIFSYPDEFQRMFTLFRYYQFKDLPMCLGEFMRSQEVQKMGFEYCFSSIIDEKDQLVEIMGYCIMPTHMHLILKQLKDQGISIYLRNILDGYTKYFNQKKKRMGPLWGGPFKNVLVETDEQLEHLSRYVHLNPATANLVRRPEEWIYSSYREYLNSNRLPSICVKDWLGMSSKQYKTFVDDQADYQKELEEIKFLCFEK